MPYEFGDFRLDPVGHELRRGGVPVALEPKAFDVLGELLAHAGALRSRDELLDAVWGHRHVTPGVLNRSIAQLRRALGDDAEHPRYIQTVHALGYRFIAAVEGTPAAGPPASTAGTSTTTPLPTPIPDATCCPPADVRANPPPASVAILPFADLSEARDQDYFCDGLAEEITGGLTRIPGLQVASRTSSFRFRDSAIDAREIGRQLNVAAIMEGSVRKSGDRVRVTAQLIDASNGYHLWSQNFDRKLEDIFAIQEEIARSVVAALRVSLTTPTEIDFTRHAPHDMRAYEYYLRGRQLESHTSNAAWHLAPQMFRRAIELDPDYAQAHAGLADALTELLLWRLAQREDVLDEALAASRRALALAPDLAECQVAHAHVLSLAGEHDAAVAAFERAIQLDPKLYEAYYYFGRHCFANGRVERAIDLLEAAHRVRPDEFQALSIAVGAAYGAGQPERARQLARTVLDVAQHQIELQPENARAYYMSAIMQLHLGQPEAGRRSIETALAIRPNDYGTLYNAACFHALAGDPDTALDLLERTIDTGEGFPEWIENDDDLASLRHLPRYRALMAQLGPPSLH
ncbi:TPR end-of-group domain-containing protein [Aerolutibacter ruishenii]|uniref:TolB-like protein n=1 Tax=Aerolutibacter ruishenii TaxID=686800 RepID=A0A562LRR6_9GAMM|nr:winged helix-turn-helix domain-containing protein [Lysobacter ruishenii]TWI10228.1 TolB-like protein [Lysobacter ruishenii]